MAAHSRYISKMQRRMFLGADRPGALARARVRDFYEVVCAVGRIADGLVSSRPSAASASPSPPAREAERGEGGAGGVMVLPDGPFAELAAVRERFDAARRGLCRALSEICAAGGGARARPLLAILGYGGYGSDDVVDSSR